MRVSGLELEGQGRCSILSERGFRVQGLGAGVYRV